MKKKIKVLVCIVLCVCIFSGFMGCAVLDDAMNEFKGNLVGNGYTIRTYDNYGNRVMTTTGDKINITGNKIEETSYDIVTWKTGWVCRETSYTLQAQGFIIADWYNRF